MQRFSTYTISRAFRNGKDAPEDNASENGEDAEEIEEPNNIRDADVQTDDIQKPDVTEVEV